MINKMRLIPLGGLNEIGKNMMAYEWNNEIIIVDVGLKFPDEELLGIDLVIANWSYISENKKKLKGVLITHGHEDHIGALPYFVNDFDVPIYGTKLTIGMVEKKLEDKNSEVNAKLVVIDPNKKFKVGSFWVEAIRVTHSIPDAVAFAITTHVGTIIQTGDFKVDYTPIDAYPIDLQKLAHIGSKGVLALLADSTNADRKGFTMSEAEVGETFSKIFRKADKSRIIIASFASNVHRVQQMVDVAYEHGRKIAYSGRSMLNTVEVAKKLCYLKIYDDNMIIDIADIDGYPDNEICIITTGSQGETFSSLTRMSNNNHEDVQIRKGDTVIFSSTPIPGNEKSVNRVINNLYEKGANVIYHALEQVHVSGHACEEELKLIYNIVQPKFAIPVHGEYTHLMQHSKIAQKSGVSKGNVFILKNGDILEFVKDDNNVTAKVVGTVDASPVLIDGLGVGDVGNIVLRDRKILSEEGLVIIVVVLDKFGNIVMKPNLLTRGFVYVRESEEFLDDARDYVIDIIEKMNKKNNVEWYSFKTKIRAELSDFIYQKMKRRPMVIPIIMNYDK